ncbi:helix-turn-helix domain-containing protein [Halalkalibacter krulwichiae]|uniref:Cytoskeletal protein RodZ n=1 Tax=Halalkalibacter krulwichiae TaxID=199441 RepID=A0A1X9MBT6_9BACI|nr:RodZ family helix-turn-helix domain-containing protein [Halalkalibacter krulwichiae]ARK30939.1 cytoskeletal protein RodZ [Halalkalibacter krulwichiae]
MSELGQFLKEAREQKNISLDDLQQTTKIQKRYLVAIEEGRFDTLPGLFYARAFVKSYAEAVGLDPEPLFDQYKNELPNPQREAVTLPSRAERSKSVSPRKRTKKGSIFPALAAIAFIVVLVVGIWIFAQGNGASEGDAIAPDDSENLDAEFSDDVGNDEEASGATEESEPVEEVETVEEEEIEEEVEPEPEFTLNFIKSEGNTSFFDLENGRLSDVLIEFNGSSYVDIKNELGKTFYSGTPTKGDELTFDFEAEERVLFNFGASQNVDFYINGEQVDFPLDRTHQKIDIEILDGDSE